MKHGKREQIIINRQCTCNDDPTCCELCECNHCEGCFNPKCYCHRE